MRAFEVLTIAVAVSLLAGCADQADQVDHRTIGDQSGVAGRVSSGPGAPSDRG